MEKLKENIEYSYIYTKVYKTKTLATEAKHKKIVLES